MITMTLTNEQAETLGFALTLAKRNVLATADIHRRQGEKCLAGGDTERARRIEELRVMLDCADSRTEAAKADDAAKTWTVEHASPTVKRVMKQFESGLARKRHYGPPSTN